MKVKMKIIVMLLSLGVAVLSRADEIEPAVNTSSPAAAPAGATPAATKAPAPPAAAKAAAPAAQPAGQRGRAHDEIVLDPTQITGNRELPNVMYVVPWKKPDLGDLAGRPARSLVDEVLAPVDRDVFRRQNRYFAALQADAAAAPPPPTVAPAAGPAITLPAGDEK